MSAGAAQGRSGAGLEVALLGPVAVRLDGTELAPGGARGRALLAMLACVRGEVVSADALQDAVWAAEALSLSRGTLHVHVHNLRARLGPYGTCVERVGAGYRLTGAAVVLDLDVVDDLVVRAESARRAGDPVAAAGLLDRALSTWRGSAVCADLPELPVHHVRTRYAHLRQEALAALFDARLAAGSGPDVVPAVEAALVEHPLSERMWGQLMVALHLSGRPADALSAYRRARAVLADEAGLDPGEDLRRLEKLLLTGTASPAQLLGGPGRTDGPALLWLDSQGRARARALPSADGVLTIGRDADVEVALSADGLVSRRHAVVSADNAGWRLRDLDSLNGTYLNGVRLEDSAPLVPGDVARVGSSVLVVQGATTAPLETLTATRPAAPQP